MIIKTFSFDPKTGWSVEPLPDLDSERTLVLLFAGAAFLDEPDPIRRVRRAYPRSHLIGCSTAGEILDTKVTDDRLVGAAVRFDHTELRSVAAPVRSAADSFAAGQSLARGLLHPGLRSIFVLSDGLHVNGSDLAAGLEAEIPRGVSVTGGLAGDGPRFARTWVITDGVPCQGMVSALGLYGDRVRVRYGSDGGWDKFGPERLVTRSEGNVLYELDRKPALELYKQYLGELVSGLPATALLFPLSVRSDPQSTVSVVRTILAIDEARSSMTFAGDIPQGHQAQLMRANFDRLVDGAQHAAQQSAAATPAGTATLAIAISCVGRRLVLGERIEEETEATLSALPPCTRQIGFYSYGEMSPSLTGRCSLHNQTMTMTTVSEA